MDTIRKSHFLKMLKYRPQSLIGRRIVYESQPFEIYDVSLCGDSILLDRGVAGKDWYTADIVDDPVIIDELPGDSLRGWNHNTCTVSTVIFRDENKEGNNKDVKNETDEEKTKEDSKIGYSDISDIIDSTLDILPKTMALKSVKKLLNDRISLHIKTLEEDLVRMTKHRDCWMDQVLPDDHTIFEKTLNLVWTDDKKLPYGYFKNAGELNSVLDKLFAGGDIDTWRVGSSSDPKSGIPFSANIMQDIPYESNVKCIIRLEIEHKKWEKKS